MIKELRYGVMFTLTTMVLFGAAYPLLVWGIGRLAFPDQAVGSVIARADGRIAGSRLIAQGFSRAEYFHPRPSAVDYNAASTGGSNLGPSNPDHLRAVQERLDAITRREGVTAAEVPPESITTSGAGLDPHIPPAAAELQVSRIATARDVSADAVRALVRAHTESPTFGFLGRPRVNVLELNRALDASLTRR